MISSDVIRGYSDTIILYLLMDKDSYGYEISKSIKDISEDTYSMKETTLYSAFNRLAKNGHIDSYYGDETQGKRRTYYRITEHGRVYYRDKCQEWVATKDLVNRFIREEDNGND